MVKNPLANAGDTGFISGPGRSHMPPTTEPMRHNYRAFALEPRSLNYCVHVWQLLKPVPPRACAHKRSHRNGKPTHTTAREQPPLFTTREKPVQERRPSTVKNAQLNKKFFKRLGKRGLCGTLKAYPSSP